MKKKLHLFSAACSALFIFLVFSCQWSVISIPENSSSKALSTFSSPSDVTATQGLYRKVVLAWTGSDKAKYYKIYSSETLDTSGFSLVYETAEGETSATISEKSGTIKYYRVMAVSYSGESSALSEVVNGSTMGVPIIQSIKMEASGALSTAYVSWWMPNCKESTYQDNVNYTVNCYTDSEGSKVFATENASSSSTSVTFSNLQTNTAYYFQVQASISSSDAEKSEIMDTEGVTLTSPLAPVDLVATQGIDTSQVVLSWKLPDLTYYKVSSDTYAPRPLYFTLERKVAGYDDSTYETISSYIGGVTSSENASENDIVVFDCDGANSGADKTITGSSFALTTDTTGKYNANYLEYVVGSTICYTDTNVTRGTQYVYRVRSYTDDVGTKKISTDISYAEAEGWPIANATFKATGTYTTDAENAQKYTQVDVNFTLNFEDFGLENAYTYVITRTLTSFGEDATEGEENVAFYASDSVQKLTDTFTDFEEEDEKFGYYKYYLYIVPYTEDEISDVPSSEAYYVRVADSGQVTVTDDADLMPKIEDFKVSDGYANKFVVSWKYEENCIYTIIWTECDSSGIATGSATELELSEGDFSVTGNIASYNHTATSGECRLYTLKADNGISVTKAYETDNDDGSATSIVSKTLGTPFINWSASSADYDKIVVTWEAVQYAQDDYEVSAVYSDATETELISSNEGDLGYTEIESKTDGNTGVTTFTCTIKKPSGFDNALISGKPITLEVTAKSSAENLSSETTSASKSVWTMGPALVEAFAGKYDTLSMTLTWNAVDGASGYLIQRGRYGSSSADTSTMYFDDTADFDTYYYDVSAGTLYAGSDTVSSSRASVASSGSIFTLTEKDCAADDSTNSYQINQAAISWGLPYGYVVIPVKTGGSKQDFTFNSSFAPYFKSDLQDVPYTNISTVNCATYGYGLDVRAHKAESGTVQTVEWTIPYHSDGVPALYRRDAGSSTNSWKKVSTSLSSGANSVNCNLSNVAACYEYAIAYGRTVSTISFSDAFVEDDKRGLATEETSGTNYDYTGVALEKLNKGYLLAVDFSAGYGGTLKDDGTYATDDGKYYSETANWAEWDYSERSIGPSSAYISIKNYNLSSKWSKVATLDKDLHYSSAETWENTTITQNGEVSVNLAPAKVSSAETVTDGTMLNTAGLLMVLRDAKHYYSLTLERGEVSATLGEDDSVYGYRQLSDAELVRIAMLSLERAIVKTGMEDTLTGTVGSGAKYIDGYSGTFGWSQDSSSKFNWYIVDYVADFTSAPGKSATIPCVISLSDPNSGSSENRRGQKFAYTIKFFCYDETSKFNASKLITIGLSPSSAYDIKLESYTANLKFAVNSSTFAAQIVRNGTTTSTVSATSSESVKRWCPINIDGNGHNEENSTYGWWQD